MKSGERWNKKGEAKGENGMGREQKKREDPNIVALIIIILRITPVF